jgi:anti-sigma factor RsiW
MSHDDPDPDISALVRRHATRHRASDALRAAVRTHVTLAQAGRAGAPGASTGWLARLRRLRSGLPWRAPAWGFAFGTALALLLVPALQRLELDLALDAELVGDHVRALRVGPLVEVASSDRHTVKPWYQGRLDYAPPVVDLAAQGFPLVGGRVEHVRDATVAALVYARDRHVIHLFVWPSTRTTDPQANMQRGFNVLHWSDGTMAYWAVSDVERRELERFAAGLRAQRPVP